MRTAHVPLVLAAALSAGCPARSGAPAPAAPIAGQEAAPPAAPPAAPAAPAAPEAADDAATLVLDGTPPIPDELRERLGQYLETRSASLTDLSPDGKRVLVTTRFGETSQVHLVERPLGARRQLTFGDEPAAAARFVPGDPRDVVYSVDEGGNEQHQIVRLDRDAGRSILLTDGASRNGYHVFSRDGARLAFSSNARNGVDFDLWVSDASGAGGAKLLLETEGLWYPLDWSRDGSRLLVGEYVSITESRLHLVEVATGEARQLSPAEPSAAYRDARFSRDGASVFVTSDREGEFVELYRLDLASGAFTPLSRDIPWNVEALDLSPDGRTLAFSVNAGGVSELYLRGVRGGANRRVGAVPQGVLRGLRFAARAPVLGFTLRSATRTGDAYTYDLRQRKLVRWTESEIGGLDPSGFVEPTLVDYETFDGARIPAFYFRPAGDGPFPVLVQIHGGPESQARPYFSGLVQYLVSERGIAVLVPNVRGSDGYGKTYLSLDDGRKREDSVKDIGALLDWIGERGELDASRVAVYGGSYGGYMVLASLVHFGDRLRAGIDTVGISSFVTFLENTADYRRALRRAEYGDESDPEMRAFLESISPLGRAAEIRSALFVAQGANDPRVPASEAEQIVRAVRAAGNAAWYMLARNEGHGFRKKENRDTFALLVALFLEEQLLGGPERQDG